jgi:hypothetical protein
LRNGKGNAHEMIWCYSGGTLSTLTPSSLNCYHGT